MQNPPLLPLHLNSVLSQVKLNHYARLTTEELIRSLEPGQTARSLNEVVAMKSNIYWIPGPWAGKLAILARPRGNDWLDDEIRGWREAGVQVVVSLLSPGEDLELGLSAEASLVQTASLRFISFPIEDYGVPDSKAALHELIKKIEHLLDHGHNVGVHCRAGIGRSSLVAACLLVSSGQAVEASFEQIQKARGVPVPDTVNQRTWVDDFAQTSLSASR